MAERVGSFLSLRELDWRWVLGVFAVLFCCLFTYKYLDFVAHSDFVSPLRPLIEEGGGIAAAVLLFPAFYLVATRFPLSAASWWKNLPIHFVSVCCFSFLLTSAMAVQRNVLFPLAGLGHYDYGYMPIRYLMEFSNHFVVYWVGIALIYLFYHVRFARERELSQAKLETSLLEARLQNLRLQLDPHFLFNTLNTISAVVYENPELADEMIGRLSTLLRKLLETQQSQQIPLGDELELLELYIHLMQARFEDRLVISMDVDPTLRKALVPQFALQPLIENAIRHGVHPSTHQIEIRLEVAQLLDQLIIKVRDYGPGLENAPHSFGIGLRNTAERLERLYGNQQSFLIRDADGGGAIVELSVPLSLATAKESTTAMLTAV